MESWRGRRGRAARAAGEIAAARGSSEAMIRYGLDRMARAHRGPELRAWLRAAREEALGGRGPACGPPVVVQILAGNVAGLAVPAALEALLARSAVLLKPAAEERVTAARFRESLPGFLADAVAVEYWTGGDERVESEVFAGADVVIGSGGEDLVASLERRVAGPRILHGPRISVGVVGFKWPRATPAWWRALGREIALWDQEGCLSPRVLFVAGEPASFAARLAEALAFWQERWPARPRTAGEAAAVHAYRARYEVAGGDAGLLASPGTGWTVVWDDDLSLEAGPPHRVVRVTRKPRSERLESLLASHRHHVQGLGLACLGPRALPWGNMARRAGVPWVATLTRLQDPPAGWRADGRSGLVDLLRWGISTRGCDLGNQGGGTSDR
jgi:hypothetical protein